MNNQPQIVIDARMINSSGIGRYLQNILPEMINYFQRIVFLGSPHLLKEKLNNQNLQIIPFDKSIYSISEQLEFSKIIPKCDIFFSPHYNIPLFSIKAKTRIATIHDVFHLAFYKDLSIPQKIYSKIVIDQALKISDHIITVSNFSKNEILKYTKKEYENKISTIYNGVKPIEKDHTTNIHSIDKNPYFLFVGNVKPHKNLVRTIAAFKLLLLDCEKNKQEKPFFIIVGKKEGFITGDNNVIDLIDNDPLLKNHVMFTGWISDNELNILYANALSLVFPSYYEGFGFPPLEALSLGCPAIVSNAACMPEICDNAVLYFDPFNVNDIYDKMKHIIINENFRNNLITNGLEHAKRFSWQISVNKHIKLFEDLLNRK